MKITVYSLTGTTSSFTAPPVLVGEPNLTLVAQAYRVYSANARQATAKTKSRAEVSRTTKKMYKQKGTGGARHGSRKAPIFVGGGVTFGPRGNQNWSLNLSKSQKIGALREVLRAHGENLAVISEISQAKSKTKAFSKFFSDLKKTDNVALVALTEQSDELRGVNNIPYISSYSVNQVTAYDLIHANTVFITREAWDLLIKRLGANKQGQLKSESKQVVENKKTVSKANDFVESSKHDVAESTAKVKTKASSAKKAATSTKAKSSVKKTKTIEKK